MSRIDQAARGRAIEAHRDQSRFALVKIAGATGLLGAVAGAALAWTSVAPGDRQLAIDYVQRESVEHIRAAITPGAQVRQDDDNGFGVAPDRAAAIRLADRMGIGAASFAILFAGGLTALQRRRWIKVAEQGAMAEVRRGARSATPEELTTILTSAAKPAMAGIPPITIGGIALPPGIENQHLLAMGSTGTGKTTALEGLGRQIVARNEAAVIYDPDGSYVSRFYRPERGDIILNCWDQRTVRWTILDDIHRLADAHRIAAILLPKPPNAGESSFWWDEARLLLAHLLHHLARTGGTLDDLAELLNGGGDGKDEDDGQAEEDHIARLRQIVRGTPAATIFTAGGEKAAASVIFMTGIAARAIDTLVTVSGEAVSFSFDRFVETLDDTPGPKPFLFLACPRRYRDLGTPIVTAWIDAIASAILRREPNRGVNIWIMLDELASLPPVQSLSNLMPEGRKFRTCAILAFQSLAQLHASYGKERTDVIAGQTSIQLLMRPGDSLTAEWATKLIGQAEVETLRPTISLDTQAKGDRGSIAPERHRESLLMDSDLTLLPNGTAFLRLAGYPVARIQLAAPGPEADAIIAPAFIEAPEVTARAALARTIPVPPRVEEGDDWLPEVGGI